jgi:ribosomal protein S18 acetylase RimI-like enzyme
MEVRPYRSTDEGAVIALWQQCGLLRPWNDPIKDIERKLRVQPELFIVGTESGAIIASAMAGYDGHRGSVYYLAVAPDRQLQGSGRAMMQEIERRLVDMGCPKLNLLIRSDNSKVRKFYESIGYATQAVECMGKRLIPD